MNFVLRAAYSFAGYRSQNKKSLYSSTRFSFVMPCQAISYLRRRENKIVKYPAYLRGNVA